MNYEALTNQGCFLLPRVLSHWGAARPCFQAFPSGKFKGSTLLLKEVIFKSPVKQETPCKMWGISCPLQGKQWDLKATTHLTLYPLAIHPLLQNQFSLAEKIQKCHFPINLLVELNSTDPFLRSLAVVLFVSSYKNPPTNQQQQKISWITFGLIRKQNRKMQCATAVEQSWKCWHAPDLHSLSHQPLKDILQI